jgi:hypothetical protein
MRLDADPLRLLLAHAAVTLAMTGVIWFVQIVHYPLFARAGATGFAAYAAEHGARTTWVVAPLMLLELAAALRIAWSPPAGVGRALALAGLVLALAIWASTAFVQVPRHDALRAGFDADVHRSLVRTNWLRTALWTARAGLALAMVAAHARASPAASTPVTLG